MTALLHITDRRTILRNTLFAPFALVFVEGCAPSGTTGTTPAPAISLTGALQGIMDIGATIAQDIPALQLAGLSGQAATTADTIIGDIQSVAGAINTASSAVAGQSTLGKIEGYLNQLEPIVAPFLGLIPGAGPVISLAIAATPALEAGLNIAVSLLTPQTKALAAVPAPAAGPGAMSPAQSAIAALRARAGS